MTIIVVMAVVSRESKIDAFTTSVKYKTIINHHVPLNVTIEKVRSSGAYTGASKVDLKGIESYVNSERTETQVKHIHSTSSRE